ncbi:PucR family transcriptional regulator [Streptomyces yatensis]|uniref:Helix-turn-helix domain-containing protein n=1 Tax=Streptomyces yatensis TaxID=155177 RepID=A0ABN2I985_9ACTN|nr:PucR family transcriptional regulator [Streptomyces yatensis]
MLTPQPQPQADQRLRGALAGALLDHIDALTTRVVADIHAHSEMYASERPVSGPDLTAVCRDNLIRALEDFGGLPPTGDFEQAARETGRRRAVQQVPLDTVLQAYRRGGRVMWQAMTEVLRGWSEVAQDTALEVAGALWETIDRYSSVMADAYRMAQLELHHRQDTRRGALFEALLDGRGHDPVVAKAAAAALGVPERDRYAMVVAAQDPAAPPHPAPVLAAADVWSFWRPRAERYAGIVRIGPRAPGMLLGILRRHLGATAGVSPPFARLAEAGSALRLAERALRTLTPRSGEVAALDERLPEALLCEQPEITERLVAHYLGGVLSRPVEREVLLETLSVWLGTGGSAGRSAERLFCHRNTVLNRIGRITELTGWSPDSGEARLGWALAPRALPGPAADTDGLSGAGPV